VLYHVVTIGCCIYGSVHACCLLGCQLWAVAERLQPPRLQINGTSASDPEKWFKFTPEVGAVGKRKPLPFAFQRVLAPPSTLVSVRMERPLGITFEMDDAG
jgi:hypothetical protein